MKQKEELSEKAVKRFLEGYNCAQSVLLTMFEHWNCKSEFVPKIATGFGGGIGRCGSVCGALTGGVMALGIKYGTNQPSPKRRLNCYELAQKLYRQFERRHRSTLCRELIGYDLSNADQLEKARNAKVFEEKCPDFIRTVVEILIDFSERPN
jgi:C_GCAxxG_C_C family probable redox protein